jgi:hypothetical protein
VIRPIKCVWCWVVGHNHQASGDYSMCWRCGQVSRVERAPLETVESRYKDLLQRLGVQGHCGAVAEIAKLRCQLEAAGEAEEAGNESGS